MLHNFKKITSLVMALFLVPGLFGGLALAADLSFSETDLNASYDLASSTILNFNGESSDYTITAPGTYVLSGTLNAALVVETTKQDKVQLVFNNFNINSTNGPAVYVKQADKVVITLADGSVNNIVDGTNYTLDAEGANAAIYSKDDLTINGKATLNVAGNTAHGIVSKDDLVIVSGTLNVQAVKDGIRGKDSLVVKDGTLTVVAGSDGLLASSEELGLGKVTILGGTFQVTAARDGIEAKGDLEIYGGNFRVQNLQSNYTADDSLKGMKAGGSIYIANGTFHVATLDDAVHANGDILIEKGIFQLASNDDGIHADGNVVINDGTITVSQSTEGLEGYTITINNGTINVNATDDGLNASSGQSTGNREAVQSGVAININGGTVNVVSTMDSLDSNGIISINGGEVNLTSTRSDGRGTSTLDANGQVSVTGGNLSTNDGGATGGDMGGFGQGQMPGGGRRRR